MSFEIIDPSIEQPVDQWFKDLSLILLRQRLQNEHFRDYPELENRLSGDVDVNDLPTGPWQVSDDILPTETYDGRQDNQMRPLHPWLDEMLADPNIGVVTGKGFYRKWGANHTADPIVIRHDLGEPHILLIERGDGTGWALPGGFVDTDEDPKVAAIRETKEESGVDLVRLSGFYSKLVYEGPVADLRATAHAWPETSAYLFNLEYPTRKDIKHFESLAMSRFERVVHRLGKLMLLNPSPKLRWQGSDDAKTAAWVPEHLVGDKLFGSHRLLIDLALREL